MSSLSVTVAMVSDMHGYLPPAGMIPDADLLVIAGDLCPLTDHSETRQELWIMSTFRDWLNEVYEFQPLLKIVGVAGNHDFVAEAPGGYEMMSSLPWKYLEDEGTEIKGLRIYGSPYSNQFGRWAFMEPEEELAERWSWIPRNLDILITHGPAKRLLDRVNNDWHADDPHVGSTNLRQVIEDVKPRLHVTGHIHESYGSTVHHDTVIYNASWCNEHYNNDHNPIQVVVL